jgi:hypothetical protein
VPHAPRNGGLLVGQGTPKLCFWPDRFAGGWKEPCPVKPEGQVCPDLGIPVRQDRAAHLEQLGMSVNEYQAIKRKSKGTNTRVPPRDTWKLQLNNKKNGNRFLQQRFGRGDRGGWA